jgi:hypothetical protein
MALSRVGSASAAIWNNESTAKTVAWPAGLSANHIAFILVSWFENGNVTFTTPLGFTIGGASTPLDGSGGSNESRMIVYYKELVGSESGTVSLAPSGTIFGEAVMVVLAGTNDLTFVSATLGTRATGLASTAPTVDGTDGQGLVCTYGLSDPPTSPTGPSGMTLGGNSAESTNCGRIYYLDLVATAATGTKVFSWTTNNRDTNAYSILINGASAAAGGNDIVAAGALSITGAASLNATGSLLAAGAASITGAADLDAVGTLAAAGAVSITGVADLDAAGVLAAAGALSITGAADLDALGSLAAAGALSISGVADLSGSDVDIVASGSLSITGSAALTALGQLLAAGSIAITGAATLDDGQVPAEPEATQRPAGRKRKQHRKRLLVEIDGRDFEVESVEQAVALLERAKEVAVKQIAAVRASPVRVAQGIKRPSIRTNSEPLRELVREKRAQIVALYDQLLRDLEIKHLMAKAEEDDEEETLIRLLM